MENSTQYPPKSRKISGFLTPRRVRTWRGYLTAYLMIAPATILVFIFGIFPVGFALFVSVHKWRLKRGGFVGLKNYIGAVGNLAYLGVFLLGIAALVFTFIQFRKVYRKLHNHTERFWILLIPSLLQGAATLAFVRWTVILLPNILDIADKIRGVEKTRELFIQLLKEAFNAENVLPARQTMLWLIAAALVTGIAAIYFWKSTDNFGTQAELALAWVTLGIGIVLIRFAYGEVMAAYQLAAEKGSDPGIIPQLINITSGVILLLIGWKLWTRASNETSSRLFLLRLFGAVVFIVGGWLMIGEIPLILSSGDKDMWQGLKVTIFYSMGTIPFQLSISLFLAILLFQNLKGSSFFRVMFFMPYVTPTVASAAVFRQLFSNRLQAPVNSLLRLLGFEPLKWLWEPKGIFTLLANKMGIVNYPDWAAGPSLALVVIIIFSIWVFVGYDTVIYMAGLGNIPTELSEAAEVDGASRWDVFRFITFPLLSPTTYFLTLIAVIGTFKAFNHIWVMRLPASLETADTFSVVIFTEFFEKLRYGYASALAFVLFAIILSLTYINNKIQGSRVFYG